MSEYTVRIWAEDGSLAAEVPARWTPEENILAHGAAWYFEWPDLPKGDYRVEYQSVDFGLGKPKPWSDGGQFLDTKTLKVT